MSAEPKVGRVFATVFVAVVAVVVMIALNLFIAYEGRQRSHQNARLLRVILAFTDCEVTDTPAQCQKRAATRPAFIGLEAEIDCRVRLALANLPPPKPGKPCVSEKESP